MSERQKIACISVIGPDYNPIILQRYCSEKQEQEIETLLFCSLDYFDSKGKGYAGFIGNILTSDRFQVWGYKTNLRYKIVVLTFHYSNLRDDHMKSICEKIKSILFSAFMDPFYLPFTPIKSPLINQKIESVAST